MTPRGTAPIADGLPHSSIHWDGANGLKYFAHLAVIVARARTWDAVLGTHCDDVGDSFRQC